MCARARATTTTELGIKVSTVNQIDDAYHMPAERRLRAVARNGLGLSRVFPAHMAYQLWQASCIREEGTRLLAIDDLTDALVRIGKVRARDDVSMFRQWQIESGK